LVLALSASRKEKRSRKSGRNAAPTASNSNEAEIREVKKIFAKHMGNDRRRFSEQDLLAIAGNFWAFAQEREKGAAKIRAFNPSLKKEGYTSRHTAIMIANDDMPFLVDSIAAELNRMGLSIHLLAHPLASVERDEKGNCLNFSERQQNRERKQESWMYIEVDETPEPAQLKEIINNLENVLQQVRYAVTDWEAMRRKVVETLTELPRNETADLPPGEREEAGNFLSWLESDHFTFLGMRDYDVIGSSKTMRLEQNPKSALGILRNKMSVLFYTDEVEGNQPSSMHQFLQRKQLIMVTKTHRASVVHRPTAMDAILVKRYDDSGKLIGERLFVGLFTSVCYSEPPQNIPLIRSKISHVIEKAGLDPVSHDGKALSHILHDYPRDELFQITAEGLYETALGIIDLQQRQHLALFTRDDAFGRFVNCLIFVPRELYDTRLRFKIQDLLMANLNGAAIDYNVKITDDPLAQIFFIVRTKDCRIPPYDKAALERAMQEASRGWSRRLQDDLVTAFGENQGLKLSRRYTNAFSDAYRDSIPPAQAMSDVAFIEDVLKHGRLEVNFYRNEKTETNQVHLKWFCPGTPLSLSQILPLMRNMGLNAETVTGPYEILPADASTSVWVQDCQARLPEAAKKFGLSTLKPKFEETLLRVWKGEVEDDSFNKLVLLAGLSWRDALILRAVGKYLRQAGMPYGEDSIIATLAAHPEAARQLTEYFHARFNPEESAANREKQSAKLEKEIFAYLEDVNLAEQDTILRRYLNVVQNILRTNYFQKVKGEPKPYVSFKIDSRKIDELPLPRPLVEIFVYSPRMEGIHLRGGKVARGGIRWSDRREDFRTEVLGLMKAQMVKNTVIVPVGSKGGFVVKNQAVPQQQEGIFCYQTLIRGMLDITDNRKGEKIIPAPQTVRYDEDDPYLVVAADKGTAKFSDIANAISIEYGFWLGDAFASGGSAGYDHKEMGITARGGWEAVKRHFRELGKNIQKTPFTVVGVGDMSGDVFGNAMLLSEKIKLLGAFNHKHIFIDPEPDVAASFAERKRLFQLHISQWSDYDKTLISKGGGVYARDAKTITLSKQARDLFGITTETITPDALVKTMLKAEVELLWFGGIGTYIKAEDESHAEVGDRANDRVRVDGEEVRAQVVGEGANLGVTQRGRISFARKGGHINTDAIDNSAGVDTSDHEVNIKILLDAAIQADKLEPEKRNRLLAKMTDDVGKHVLRDNYLQTLALSLTENRAGELLPLHARLITQLERAGLLNRWVEFLPDDEELHDRLRAGAGLTRPELAVLMAYAKIALYNELLASTLPENPGMEGDLFRYFPTNLHEPYGDLIRKHRLRREIIATFATNSLVNRAGAHFTIMMREKTGKSVPEIVTSYAVTRDIYGLRPLWRSIEKLDSVVGADIQTSLCLRISRMVERTAERYLQNASLEDTAALVKKHSTAVEAIRAWLEENREIVLGGRTTFATRRAEYVAAGVPEKLVEDILLLPILGQAPEIIAIAEKTGQKLEDAAALYFAVERRFKLFELRSRVRKLTGENHWQREASANMLDDFYYMQAALARRVLASASIKKTRGADNLNDVIDAWLNKEGLLATSYDALLTEMAAAQRIDPAMLNLALRHLNNLLKNGNGVG
jgi:glutamate dehydrogenase